MTRYEKILETISNMNNNEIVSLHNEYCINAFYPDDHIYTMNEIDEQLEGYTPMEIIRKTANNNFNIDDDYFVFDGYLNLISFNNPKCEKSPVYIDELAQHIDDYDDSLSNNAIQKILDSE